MFDAGLPTPPKGLTESLLHMIQHRTTILPERLFTLGQPLDLSQDRFGFLHETRIEEEIGVLRQRMQEDGY